MIESLECRRLFVSFDDLLNLIQNDPNNLTRWQAGDFQLDMSSVSFDDLLLLAQMQTSSPTNNNASLEPFGASAKLDGRKLVVNLNEFGNYHLRATTTGQKINIHVSDRSGRERQLISVKKSSVKSVQVNDANTSNIIGIHPSFPAATIYLNRGDDSITTSSGQHTIYGGAGDDAISAGDGDDLVYGEGGNDRLYGHGGNDRLYGGEGDDTIYAGGGDDLVYGGEGNDSLFGEGGTDYLDGGAHKDFLDGGAGKNTLVGGSGTDRFVVRPTKNKIADREDRDHVKVIG